MDNRRSISISENNNNSIIKIRGAVMTTTSKDIDYTAIMNMLLTLGLSSLERGHYSLEDTKTIEVFLKPIEATPKLLAAIRKVLGGNL
jgi:hypothetical protein